MKLMIPLLILLFSIQSFGSDYQIDTIKIQSKILSEDREVILYKPANLNQCDSVIFIYLLDGKYSGIRYQNAFNEFPGKKIIGVGILDTDRRRDMLPLNQPENFLGFLEHELIPIVEKDYKLINRILFGHSIAGGFVINSMIKSPGLFNKYIASSPTPIMQFVNSDTYQQLDNELSTDIKFYFSCGSKDMRQVRKWTSQLHKSLSTSKLINIKWKFEIYQNKNHNNADLISLIKGIRYNMTIN